MEEKDSCLDKILVEIGDFGTFQWRIAILLSIISTITYFPSVIWIFETKQTPYRCEIYGCESIPTQYKPPWWVNAIPSIKNEPSQCQKYKQLHNESYCGQSDFDKRILEKCNNYVYATDEISILQDFDLHCSNNLWKLTLVGTMNRAGDALGLPLAGILSDKFGRKTILIASLCLSGLSGLIRSFSNSYIFFIVWEFIESVFRAAGFPICVILGVEFVSPNKRVLLNTILAVFYAFGGLLIGGLAWILQTWRTLDQVLYAFTMLTLTYYWFLPESVRWLISKKKYIDAERILGGIAKTNGKTLSESQITKIRHLTASTKEIKMYPVKELFKSSILIRRFICCSFCWMSCLFSYYGMALNSVALSNNSYLDFILAALFEIPGYVAAYFVVDKIGRRICLSVGNFISGISCLSIIFLTTGMILHCRYKKKTNYIFIDIYWLKLSIYILGKFGISIVFSTIYNLTAEMFPTSLRTVLLSSCVMFGAIGSLIAPQIPLLELYWKPLPLTLLGGTSIVCGILSLLLPETKNTILPNTIEEAENIGRLLMQQININT